MSGPVVHTRTEAMRLVSTALVRFDHESRRFTADARAGFAAVVSQIKQVLVERQRALDAAQRALEAADEDSYQACLGAVRQAQDQLARAERALTAATQAADDHAGAERRFSGEVDRAVGHAVSDLQSLGVAIERYAAMAGAVGGAAVGGAARSGAGSGGAAAAGGLDAALADRGLENVSVDLPDYADNPLLDDGKGGATAADYRWAVEKWDTQVAPGVAQGMTREDFEAMDTASGSGDFRKLAMVHDMMLGSDAIALTRGPDGKVDVQGGRHRLEAARTLGVTHLPMRWV